MKWQKKKLVCKYLCSETYTLFKRKEKNFLALPEKLREMEKIDFCNVSVWTTTLRYLTAHHETREQREVHTSVLPPHIVGPDNRERYTLVSYSHTSSDLTTERGTH